MQTIGFFICICPKMNIRYINVYIHMYSNLHKSSGIFLLMMKILFNINP